MTGRLYRRRSGSLAGVDVTIREGTLGDREGIERCLAEVDALHYTARPDVWRRPPSEDDRVPWMLSGPEHTVFVATDGDEVVGMVHLVEVAAPVHVVMVPRRFVQLTVMVVREPWRRRGIGGALLARAEDWVRARGVGSIELNVAAFNESATTAWERLGFRTFQRRMGKRL